MEEEERNRSSETGLVLFQSSNDAGAALRAPSSSSHTPIPRHVIPHFAARHQPADSVRLSSLFLTGHLQWFSTLTESELSGLMARMHLRDKLLQGVWMNNLLTPSDMTRLAHSLPANRNWWRKYFNPHDRLMRLPYDHTPLFERLGEGWGCGGGGFEAERAGVLRPHGLCDGRACYGFCVFLDVLTAATSCRISFERSPLLALPDQTNAPNQPFIAIRRLHNEDVTRYQEVMVEALCRQMSDSLTLNDSSGAPHISEDEQYADSKVSRPHSEEDHTLAAPRSTPSSAPLAVPMSVQCNSAFERLLGYSQSELRQLFLAHGDAALYTLFAADDWAALMQLDKDVKLGRRVEYRVFLRAVTCRRSTIGCLLHVQNEFDCDGKTCVTYLSFTPLPDECSYPTKSGPVSTQ